MKRSTARILTTHVGSLPRPRSLIQLLQESQSRPGAERSALDAGVQRAVADVVKRQSAAGLDVINDGEQGRVDYTVYVKDRLTGFDGASAPPLGTGDEEFPELAAILRQFASPFQHRPACTGPVVWKAWRAVEADISVFRAAAVEVATEEFFLTSPSPGQIGRFLRNQYYPDDEAYLYALPRS
jgi:5-methyltetrahydropteroyltriglutamate--homocysteine methyltransferase